MSDPELSACLKEKSMSEPKPPGEILWFDDDGKPIEKPERGISDHRRVLAGLQRIAYLERENTGLQRRNHELWLQTSELVAICSKWFGGEMRARKAMKKIWKLI